MASSSRTMEELEHRWDTICLEEEEESEEILEDEGDGNPEFDVRWSLVGKLLIGRISNYKVFQNMIADLWKPGKGMTVKILEQNRFLFQFYHEIDIQRVINGSPWTFDRKHLILKRLKTRDNPKMVELDTIDMWVQIHDLQSGFKTEQAVQKAGNYIGTFLSSDPYNFHAPPRRNNFPTASPWLRQSEAAQTDTGGKNSDEDIEVNAPHDTRLDGRENNIQRNKYGNLHDYGKDIAYNSGVVNVKSNMALNEPVVLVKENNVLFSSDMELSISELKRRRVKLVNTNDPTGPTLFLITLHLPTLTTLALIIHLYFYNLKLCPMLPLFTAFGMKMYGPVNQFALSWLKIAGLIRKAYLCLVELNNVRYDWRNGERKTQGISRTVLPKVRSV
ncbi:hypothetical protein G4B88_000132 [Cannabis sativa]|uniref:DUF4283 domain-containing protein n=1 Tax=Cannabis sativa TaxID=3483 RepID=A0A7J6G0B8_CANSA|nr:hypothetical protein G4B88_000132 [Cannabis sativa]